MTDLMTYNRKDSYKREIFSLFSPSVEALPDFDLPSPRFACFIACDAADLSKEELSPFCETIVRRGGVYFCTWGPKSDKIHDTLDEVITNRELNEGAEANRITTTRHEIEPLEDALSFVLNSAEPDAEFTETCRSTLILVVGNEEWNKRIQALLKDEKGELIWS